MLKIKNGARPAAFHTTFKMRPHPCPTRFSRVNCNKSRFRISTRGPAIWNNFVANTEKVLESSSLFKSKVKTKLLDFENELIFFQNKHKV